MRPAAYDVSCDLCDGEVEWSEYEHRVWCKKCQKDTPGNLGIFDGPIPYEASKLFGISFDRIDIKTKKRLYMKTRPDKKGVMWERVM